MKRILLLLCFVCCVSGAQAQLPVMVQDINTTSYASSNSDPTNFIVWNGYLYFFANDSTHGKELWKYNEIGPATMVYDLNPGAWGLDVASQTVYKGKLYFSGRLNPTNNNTLFVYDGTNPPHVAAGLSSFTPIAALNNLTVAGNNLYFTTTLSNTPGGIELYSYDGSNPPVKVTLPLPAFIGSYGSKPQDLITFNGNLYFTGYTSTNSLNSAIYKVDPVTNVFTVISTPAFPNSFPLAFWKYVAGGKLYFLARADTAGNEVYSYDGITANRLTNIYPGSTQAQIRGPFAVYNGSLYYSAGSTSFNMALHRCNPITGGDTLVYEFTPGGDGGSTGLLVCKNKLYMGAGSPSIGRELWRYDGVTATLVEDLWPGHFGGIKYGEFIVFNNHLYFNGDDSVHGTELYRLNDPTSVQSVKWGGEVSLYPNPANTSATLAITLPNAQSLQVLLTDISGKEVFSTGLWAFSSGKNDVRIPMQGLASGQYFYRIVGSEGRMLASGSVVRE